MISHFDSTYPWYNGMKMALYLCGLPKILYLNLIMRQSSDKSQLTDILENTWPILLRTVQVIKNKERMRKYHSQKDSMEMWPTRCNVAFWVGSWKRNDIRWKVGKYEQIWTLLNDNISILVHKCNKCTTLM